VCGKEQCDLIRHSCQCHFGDRHSCWRNRTLCANGGGRAVPPKSEACSPRKGLNTRTHVRSHLEHMSFHSERADGMACMRAGMTVDRHCGKSAPSVHCHPGAHASHATCQLLRTPSLGGTPHAGQELKKVHIRQRTSFSRRPRPIENTKR
jgi:hypothetical protein